MHETRQKRIPKDCYGHSNWICHHGLHWILCQTHPHPHQQHHCWWLNHLHCEPIQTLGCQKLFDDELNAKICKNSFFLLCVLKFLFGCVNKSKVTLLIAFVNKRLLVLKKALFKAWCLGALFTVF